MCTTVIQITVLIIFALILQTIIVVQMTSTGGKHRLKCWRKYSCLITFCGTAHIWTNKQANRPLETAWADPAARCKFETRHQLQLRRPDGATRRPSEAQFPWNHQEPLPARRHLSISTHNSHLTKCTPMPPHSLPHTNTQTIINTLNVGVHVIYVNYTVSQKKGSTYGYNFVNSWSICKVLSLVQRALNFKQNPYWLTHHTLCMLLNYLGKLENLKLALYVHVKCFKCDFLSSV